MSDKPRPAIFGRKMTCNDEDQEYYCIVVPGLDASIYPEKERIHWCLADADGDVDSVDQAVLAIEQRIRDLVLTLLSLLDDSTLDTLNLLTEPQVREAQRAASVAAKRRGSGC